MQTVRVPCGNKRGEGIVGITATIPKAEPLRHSGNMGIHGKFFAAESKKKHYISRLLSHPRQRKEPFFCVRIGKLRKEVQTQGAALLLDSTQDFADPSCPLAKKARRFNCFRHFLLGSGKDILPAREARAKGGISLVAIAVGSILGKNGANKDFEGVRKPGLLRFTKSLAEAAVDFFHKPGLHRPQG